MTGKTYAFGCAVAATLFIPPQSATATTFNVLYAFCAQAGCSDGQLPSGNVVMDKAGDIYGTTVIGGAMGHGAIYRLSSGGTETVLYSFTGGNDGSAPTGGLIADKHGNLYGTTHTGGAGEWGTVYKFTPGGTMDVLWPFTNGSDGGGPFGVVVDTKGNLYGTTDSGGTGGGTVYKVSNKGKETTLHTFSGDGDGSFPQAGLLLDKKGNLFGTTTLGGTDNLGTVFEITHTGAETVLYSFPGGSSGQWPVAGLIEDAEANLYGAAQGGTGGGGVAFELAPNGTQTVLHTFGLSQGDGNTPQATLTRDSHGNLYGTTVQGGTTNNGVVFELAPGGSETVLYEFTGGTDGSTPYEVSLILKKNKLYGTASSAGAHSGGTVYSIAP